MSYDIDLINRQTKETIQMTRPAFIRSGTIPAALQSDGTLRPCKQIDASINITYNYGHYYREATECDERFAHTDADGEVEYGIRGLYGKTALESLGMLTDMCHRIQERYTDENGKWLVTKRKKVKYFDKDGHEIKDSIGAILHGVEHTTEEYEYEVSEGDTDNYWEATAANAIEALLNMMLIATDSLTNPDAVWDGD